MQEIQEAWVRPLSQEDLLEKGLATHSSIHAWGIPWTGEPGGLKSMKSQRVRHNWATNALSCLKVLGNKGIFLLLNGYAHPVYPFQFFVFVFLPKPSIKEESLFSCLFLYIFERTESLYLKNFLLISIIIRSGNDKGHYKGFHNSLRVWG